METVYRMGLGTDIHAFAPQRKCIIGGVEIPHSMGLAGHSDADVLYHAIADALLGAVGLEDIGHYFPDNNPAHKNMDSSLIVLKAAQLVAAKGGEIINLDCVIMAQVPKIGPYRESIKANICRLLNVESSQVAVKATTTEHLGFVGRKEGILAQCVVSVKAPIRLLEV
jgi:2-C-methyl-D-erythritol 2,4-cyclodiphosphate synthase